MVYSSVHFFRFRGAVKCALFSILEQRNWKTKKAAWKLDPKKAVFRAGKCKNAKKRTRHFRPENARVRNALGQKKAGGQNAGNPLGLVGGKEKKFDQKKKFFNSQVRFREIKIRFYTFQNA